MRLHQFSGESDRRERPLPALGSWWIGHDYSTRSTRRRGIAIGLIVTTGVLGAVMPSADAIASALAGRDRLRLRPSGAYAANLLGLSEQVPAKVVFLTDGATRTVRVGSTTIQLRRTTPRNMATAGRLSGLLIQALRALGRRHVTPRRIAHLKRTIPAAERRPLIKELRFAPAWMHPVFRELAGAPR